MCWCCGTSRHTALWPVFWILVGVVVLLYNLGLLPAGVIAYWPVVLVLGGLFALISGDMVKMKKS